MRLLSIVRCMLLVCVALSRSASGAEIALLTPETIAEFAPRGKEADAIFGDIVLRNEHVVAVVAQPLPTRNANMTVKNVGGCLIDFTSSKHPNDQLSAFFPLGKATNWRGWASEPAVDKSSPRGKAGTVAVVVRSTLVEGKLEADTTYVLADGADRLEITTTLRNLTDAPHTYTIVDDTRADGTVFVRGNTGDLQWAYDRWWNAAFGVVADRPKDGKVSIGPKDSFEFKRQALTARDLRSLQSRVSKPTRVRALSVVDSAGKPVADVYVEATADKKIVSAGKTDAAGSIRLPAVDGMQVKLVHAAFGETTLGADDARERVEWTTPGVVVAEITDVAGGPTPCKVQFRAVGGGADPFFFDKSGEHAVGNLYYSHDGRFHLALPPGKYACTVSRGPEFDAVEREVTVESGRESPLAAKLERTVDTTGWISTDYHNHASPSGDNVSSQFGRVLNLLCENVEYAPCTEHNRISTYVPHLKRLKVEHLLGTCSGMELTSTPLPLGHLNAFPLKLHQHTQDNGAPQTDLDIELQAARLALWDDRSEKLVQQNHPDLGWLFYDKNGDGVPDAGHAQVLPHLDVMEVHPPGDIFKAPLVKNSKGETENNTMLNWMQMINQGVRVPGVVNTDAHYNIHGSGWLRNWIASPTDDPDKVEVLDVVHESEHGHIVMSNGPFLTVAAADAEASDKQRRAIPGDDLTATGGKVSLSVRVQCPNWFDVDRVQVFVNGRPDPKLNFTRAAMPEAFGDKVVKFDRELKLELKGDAHLVVAATGENSRLGHVMGPEHEKTRPIAVSNPIFVDVDGGGFEANGDTLGAPLPVKAGMAK